MSTSFCSTIEFFHLDLLPPRMVIFGIERRCCVTKDRIKAVRKAVGMNQTEFGNSVGVTLSAEQKWELGISVPSDAAIMNIVRRYNVNETWLRTGAGEMFGDSRRSAELADSVKRLFSNRPASFQTALISTLLRFDPDGEEWKILENIYSSIASEMEQGQDT